MDNIKNLINYWAFLCEDNTTSNGDFWIEDSVLKKYNGDDSNVVIPDSVKSIGESAFSFCTSLTSITIPDSVTSIGDYAFIGCNILRKVKLPKGINYIRVGLKQKQIILLHVGTFLVQSEQQLEIQ